MLAARGGGAGRDYQGSMQQETFGNRPGASLRGGLSRVNYICRPIASNQMLSNFGLTKSLGGSSHEIGVTRQRRRKDPTQRIGGADLYVRRAGVRPLLIPVVVRPRVIT